GRQSLRSSRASAQSCCRIAGGERLLGPRARRAAVRPGPLVAAPATRFAAGGTAESPAPPTALRAAEPAVGPKTPLDADAGPSTGPRPAIVPPVAPVLPPLATPPAQPTSTPP